LIFGKFNLQNYFFLKLLGINQDEREVEVIYDEQKQEITVKKKQ